MSITQADNECRLEGDKTHEIFHFLSKKVGGGHFLCGPHQAEKWGDASPRPPPIYARDINHKKTKQARLGQIILSGILPVCGNRIQGYRNSKRMAVNGMVERLCKEEEVGYVDMWDSFVGNEELYFRDGLHLSGKGAAVLAEGLSGAVASGLGKVRYLN